MFQHPPPPPDAVTQEHVQHGIPQPDQATDFNPDPGLSDEGFAFSDAQGCWDSSAVDAAHAVDTAAFVPLPGLDMSCPAVKDHHPSRQTLFHAAGSRTWQPPEEWECPDSTFLPGSCPLAADNTQVVVTQVAVNEPGATILQSPPSAAIGAPVPSLEPDEQQQQEHRHHITQPIPGNVGHKHWWQRTMGKGGSSSSRRVKDGHACWRCRAGRLRCDDQNPCAKCSNSSDSAAIPCERGPVCVMTGRSGICHLLPKSSSPIVPPALSLADRCIRDTRRRRQELVDRFEAYCSNPASLGNQNEPVTFSVLFRVVKAQVENARELQPMQDAGIMCRLPESHRNAILKITWELEDNPNAARLLDIGSVADLVALLETASLCEILYGRSKSDTRIVYISLLCLWYCLEAVRLSVARALPTTPAGAADAIHAYCTQANECIVPALRRVGQYVSRYVEVLTTELFSRNNDWSHNWLLVFYSLCIQSYVRRALVSLEGEGHPLPNSSAHRYLHKAVRIFGHISERGSGKLGKKIDNARAKPAAYAHLRLAPHPTRPGGGGSWETWHEEGFLRYLKRVYELPPSSSDIPQPHLQPHHNAAASGALLVPGPYPNNWDMMETPHLHMQAQMAVSGGGGSSSGGAFANMECWTLSPPPPTNISVPSFSSMTTTGQIPLDYTPAPSIGGLTTPSMSMVSLSTATDGNFGCEFE